MQVLSTLLLAVSTISIASAAPAPAKPVSDSAFRENGLEAQKANAFFRKIKADEPCESMYLLPLLYTIF